MPTALITGASRGLGRAIGTGLARRGWNIVADARTGRDLEAAAREFEAAGSALVATRVGDVADAAHRNDLRDLVGSFDGLDLLVNNASILGPSPLVPLAEHPLDSLEQVYAVNTFAPLALVQLLLGPLRRSDGRVLNLSSDAAVESYAGWGGYGSAKAALDHLSGVLAVELPDLRIYAVDPGDMATDLHQAAFPGEDISDRPAPETVVPALLRLVEGDLPSGRYRASDLARVVTS